MNDGRSGGGGGTSEADAAADAKERALRLADRARAAGHAIPKDLVGVAWEWRRFNPPWTIGFMKTNEVCIPL